MTLIEVIMAFSLLAMIALMLVGWIMTLSRLEVRRVDDRAKANAVATRYLELQRARIRSSSFRPLTEPIANPILEETQTVEGTDYTAKVELFAGSVQSGEFADRTPNEVPHDEATGDVYQFAAVRVRVTVTWPSGKKPVIRECILVPRPL